MLLLLISCVFCLLTVLLTDENDHRPYDPFGDDDAVTSSVPVVPISRSVTTATATSATVRTVFWICSGCLSLLRWCCSALSVPMVHFWGSVIIQGNSLGGIAANMLFGRRGSRMGSAVVPLDRALLSFYRLPIVTIPLSVMVWPQICNANFDWGQNQLLYQPPNLQFQCFCQTASDSVQRL